MSLKFFKSRDIILEMMPKGVHKAAGLNQFDSAFELTP